MRILIGLAVIVTAPAAPAFGQDPAEDKIVCKRRDDGNTGSTFKRWTKVCKKKSEWAAAEDETFRSLQRARDRGAADPNAAVTLGGAAPR